MIKVKCDPAGLPGIAYDCWHEMRDIHLRTSDKLSVAIRPPAVHKMLVEEVSLEEWLDETEDKVEDIPPPIPEDGIPVLYPDAAEVQGTTEAPVDRATAEDNRPAIEFIQVVLT